MNCAAASVIRLFAFIIDEIFIDSINILKFSSNLNHSGSGVTSNANERRYNQFVALCVFSARSKNNGIKTKMIVRVSETEKMFRMM